MKRNNSMNIAYVMMILACISMCWLIIPLIWLIPMTLKTKALVNEYRPAAALGICEILFGALFGLIAGILVLINSESAYVEESTTSSNNLQEEAA
ncbi:hypothetical protein [Spiroplasma alleghenense]|uniref:Uncharacterized protein n=1 Tax=Spiroplasma alleghenense TaxID=216931 RepID=A0A345Z2X8_9MOLU|nr:hypothetical protein [Spiroplasma alleghenense]AXK50957.1 hypothetical protein SALLE_v1c02810 [Spiroplasma alleghenense]